MEGSAILYVPQESEEIRSKPEPAGRLPYAAWGKLRLRQQRPLFFFVLSVFVPLLLYVFTMPTGVVVEDDGLFLINGVFLGVQHPPGYPVFTVVHHLFQQIPFWSPAVKGHLLSAIFGASACGLVYLVAFRVGAGALPAVLGAWMLAVCEHFWSQAIITEVYTLNVLLFFGVAFCLVELWRDPVRLWPWLLASVCYGLGLANNWPLMVLSGPAFLVALWPLRHHLLRRFPVSAGLLFVSMGVPYAWLYSHSRSDPDFSFMAPFQGYTDFLSYLGRRNFAGVDVHPSWGWHDFIGYLGWLGHDVFHQVAVLGGFVVLLGLLWMTLPSGRFGWLAPGRPARWFALFSVAAFLCNSVLLLLFLRNEYDDYGLHIFQPYPLVCYGVVAVWFALGLGALARASDAGLFRRLVPARVSGVALATLLGTVLVFTSLAFSWEQGDRRDDDFADRYADYVFESVGEGSTLLLGNDLPTHVLGYRHFVLGERPDLRLVNVDGLVLSTNLRKGTWHDDRLDVLNAIDRHVRNSGRDVYWVYSSAFPILPHYKFTWNGPTALLTSTVGSDLDTSYVLTDVGMEYGDWLLDVLLEDGSERSHRNVLLFTYCSYASSLMHFGNLDDAADLSHFVERAWDDPVCLQGMAYAVLERLAIKLYESALSSGSSGPHRLPPLVDLDMVDSWLIRAHELQDSGEFGNYVNLDAELLNSMGKLRLLQGRPGEASRYFERSGEIYEDERNFGLTAPSW